MQKLKITIVGNSVALRTRPPQPYPLNRNYGQILENLLQKEYPAKIILTENTGIGRATIINILDNQDQIIRTFPDYFVVNIGVCDASTREIPFWYAEILAKRRSTLIRKLLFHFHNRLIKPFRPFFVKVRGKRTWVSQNNYNRLYRKFINLLKKETNAKIIILSINRGNQRVESAIPGSLQNYQKYNQIMQEIAEETNSYFISLEDLKSEIHFPDGIHYSLTGHEKVAEKIFDIIQMDLKNDGFGNC